VYRLLLCVPCALPRRIFLLTLHHFTFDSSPLRPTLPLCFAPPTSCRALPHLSHAPSSLRPFSLPMSPSFFAYHTQLVFTA
jgi:hypothetical protein